MIDVKTGTHWPTAETEQAPDERPPYQCLAMLVLLDCGVGMIVLIAALALWAPALAWMGLGMVGSSCALLCLALANCFRPLGIEGAWGRSDEVVLNAIGPNQGLSDLVVVKSSVV